MQLGFKLLTIIFIFRFFAGCSSPPLVPSSKEKPPTQKESVWNPRLDARLHPLVAPEAEKLLQYIYKQLADKNRGLQFESLKILLIANRSERWQSFASPENRIYLPKEAVLKMNYENQLASFLAIQLAHLLNRDVLKRVETGTAADLFGPEGRFDFSEEYITELSSFLSEEISRL